MKTMIKIILTAFALFLTITGSALATPQIYFNESVLPYKDGFLIPNYSEENKHGGYVLYYDEKARELEDFIKPDGILMYPTGMAIYQDKLFICNKTNVLVYDMNNLSNMPRIISLAEDDTAVNDIVVSGDKLYVTVTNTSRIYEIDPKTLKVQKWLDMPTPNGIAAYKDSLYVVSIPADYANVVAENVVYVIKDKNNPVAEKFNDIPGLYDGAAITDDGKTLYVSDWQSASVKAIDTATGQEKAVYTEENLSPADIALDKNRILIPDILKNRVIIYNLNDNSIQTVE